MQQIKFKKWNNLVSDFILFFIKQLLSIMLICCLTWFEFLLKIKLITSNGESKTIFPEIALSNLIVSCDTILRVEIHNNKCTEWQVPTNQQIYCQIWV